MLKISIITPVKNGEKFIKDTIASVFSQKGDFELEYLILDGKSSDSTIDIVKSFGNKLTLISEKDEGPAQAINKGMHLATGDILAYLNADDLYEENCLAKVAQTFTFHPEVNWLFGRCRIIDSCGHEIRREITLYKNLLSLLGGRNLLLCENYINQPATFWRKEFWNLTGGMSEKLRAAFDYELWLKMYKLSNPFFLRQYLAKFRRHDLSISEKFTRMQFGEELTIAKQYGGLLHGLIHDFNRRKILFFYKLMRFCKH